MHYLNDATLQRYKDADVKYVQILAARDERTCDICGGYHENGLSDRGDVFMFASRKL